MGVPEGEEEEQDIENIFEKIMEENFPNLEKERLPESQGNSKSLKARGPQEAHQGTSSLSYPRLKTKRES